MNEKDIRNFVPLGRDHAISCRHLAEKMGISERDVQAAVLQARSAGYPICSTPGGGYYMPLSVDEALPCAFSHAKRIKTGFIVWRTIKNYMRFEASREQWERLEEVERELSDMKTAALGATNTENGSRN